MWWTLLIAAAAALGFAGLDPHAAPSAVLILELRIFDGQDEVTSETRISVHRAGERETPVAQLVGRGGKVELKVPEGIYDVQAIQERDGAVVNIRWANRLVVMPYPDEQGRHLEVVNFAAGYGALQVRTADGTPPDARLHPPGRRETPAARPLPSDTYTLFVVPAGRYDLAVRSAAGTAWHPGLEVPLDRTRLWLQR